MVVSTDSTLAGRASVRTPTGPIGQSELIMSNVCWARSPGGVLVSIWRPAFAAFACGGAEGAHAGTRVTTSATAALNASARCSARRRLPSLAGPRNVHHNFELQQ